MFDDMLLDFMFASLPLMIYPSFYFGQFQIISSTKIFTGYIFIKIFRKRII